MSRQIGIHRIVGGLVLERLLEGACSAAQLADELGCSDTTIRRSIRWLRECDVPVVADRQPAFGVPALYSVGSVERVGDYSLADLVLAGVLGRGEAIALATRAACSLPRGVS